MGLADPPPMIRTARDAADLFAPHLSHVSDERLIVAFLDKAGRLLALEEQKGERDRVALPIRRIVHAALERDAAALILGHNHPSGDPSPSANDKAMTRRLADILTALDLKLRDHLIFAGENCRSLRAMGLI